MSEDRIKLWRQVRAEKKRRNYIFWTVMSLSFFYLAVVFLFGDMGFIAHQRLGARRDALRAELAQVKNENASLSALLQDFKSDEFVREKYAREDFGLSKKGEYIFLFQNGKKE